MNRRTTNVLGALFALGSVSATAGVVWRRFHPPEPSPPAGRAVANWRGLSAAGHRRGAAEPVVTVVAFGDYQCAACRSFELVLETLLSRHPDEIQIVHRHFPLNNIHPLAWKAANAAECAHEQGHFTAMHAALYASQDSIGTLSWVAFATRAGVRDTLRFRACVEKNAFARVVAEDTLLATALGLSGTPSIVVNDSVYTGGRGYQHFATLLAVLRARSDPGKDVRAVSVRRRQ